MRVFAVVESVFICGLLYLILSLNAPLKECFAHNFGIFLTGIWTLFTLSFVIQTVLDEVE